MEETHCAGHQELRDTVIRIEERLIAVDKRINGSINAIEKHIDNSRPRNIAIAGLVITIFIFIYNMAISLGENKRQVDINSQRWDRYLSAEVNHK